MSDNVGGRQSRSATPGGNPFGGGTPEARDYEALMSWRDGLRARNDKSASQFKDITLKQIVVKIANTGLRSAEDIAAALTNDMKPFTGDIATVLEEAQANGNGLLNESWPGSPLIAFGAARDEPLGPAEGSARSERPEARSEPDVRDSEASQLALNGFAPYAFSLPERDPVGLRIAPLSDGGVSLFWPAYDDEGHSTIRIYRLVASDHEALYSPDQGDVVAAVLGLTAPDRRPLTSAERRYQVWCNSGPTIEAAKASQPRLHAQDLVVCSVNDFELREDTGTVIGQWAVWPGVRRVQVFRIPIEVGAREVGNPHYRILAEEDNVGGFVDAGAERGRHFVYFALAEVESNGVTRLSAHVGRDVRVSVVLQPVTDLVVTQHGDDDDLQFDLSWSAPPVGQVVIFRTEAAPPGGVEDREQAESGLELANLRPADRLPYPPTAMRDGRSGMRNIPWPHDWTMTYFTPVTLFNGRAYVGAWQSSVRLGTIRDVAVRERVTEQVLTFSWPAGADTVNVYVSPRGLDSSTASQSGAHELSKRLYAQQGGLRFPVRLPSERGCRLHLVPSAFQRGQRHSGSETIVDYLGLLCVNYNVVIRRHHVRNRPISIAVTITAERDVPVAPGFALIYNEGRLPLHIRDGVPLPVTRVDKKDAAPAFRILPSRLGPVLQDPGWIAQLENAEWLNPDSDSFIRLFADLPAEELVRVAVLDPPISNLRLR